MGSPVMSFPVAASQMATPVAASNAAIGDVVIGMDNSVWLFNLLSLAYSSSAARHDETQLTSFFQRAILDLL